MYDTAKRKIIKDINIKLERLDFETLKAILKFIEHF